MAHFIGKGRTHLATRAAVRQDLGATAEGSAFSASLSCTAKHQFWFKAVADAQSLFPVGTRLAPVL